jgi:hypothetical protein
MPELDLARLKRLKGAVDSLVADHSTDTFGRTAAYMAIRGQVLAAVPDGLVAEATAIAPEVREAGGHDLLGAKRSNDQARAHLQTLRGWLASLTAE